MLIIRKVQEFFDVKAIFNVYRLEDCARKLMYIEIFGCLDAPRQKLEKNYHKIRREMKEMK
jgi:hypothetical protein